MTYDLFDFPDDVAPAPAPAAQPFTMAELLQAYLDCRRNKRNTTSALRFEQNMERNLCALRERLLAGAWRPGRSTCFVITRPKTREVWAADFPDRVVHHLFYNRVAARVHATFIAHSYACIPGRGTMHAGEHMDRMVRSVTQNWAKPAFYLKCDLANFFVAIDKKVLQAQLHRHVARIEGEHCVWWQALGDAILMHDPRQDVDVRCPQYLLQRVPAHKSLFNAPADTGLPIGNLSSQFFANVYLDRLDQFAKHQIRARYYARYVDDFVLLHPSADWLHDAHQRIAAFLPEQLHAQLNPSKTVIQPVARGIDFVGHVVKPWRRTTRPRTLATALKRLRAMAPADAYAAGNSYFGLVRQADHSYRDQTILAKELLRQGFTVEGRFTKAFRSGLA